MDKDWNCASSATDGRTCLNRIKMQGNRHITKIKTQREILNSSNERCVYLIFCKLNTSFSLPSAGPEKKGREWELYVTFIGRNLRSVKAIRIRAVADFLQFARSCIASSGDLPRAREYDRAAKAVCGLFTHRSSSLFQ